MERNRHEAGSPERPGPGRGRRRRGHVIEALGVTLGVAAFGLLWAAVEAHAPSLYPGAVVEPPAPSVPSEGPEGVPAELAEAIAALPQAPVWLLDGYNVLHTAFFRDQPRRRWWREPHRQRLVECVHRFAAPADELWVVFDGPVPEPDPPSAQRVRVLFAPSADAWIRRRVRAAEHPDQIAVVTSDRKVQGRAAHHGARVVAPADFLAACRPSDDRVAQGLAP